MKIKTVEERMVDVGEELFLLTYHSDLAVFPVKYNYVDDIFNIEIVPKQSTLWAKTAYQFANHPNMKYDKYDEYYRLDGQPRVSSSGQVWVRYITPFLDYSKVAMHIHSKQPSHRQAQNQLARFYNLFYHNQGLEPIEVFRKFMN